MDSYSFLKFLINFRLANEIRCSQSKLKSSETMKCHLMTSYVFDPNNFHQFCSKNFVKLSHNERGQEVHENYINGVSKQIIWGKCS